MGAVVDATAKSIEAATHLGPADAGAVAVLTGLAVAVDFLLVNDGLTASGKLDNVSVPTYLRYCESLGLTPAGRDRLKDKKQEAPSGKLAGLRSVPKPA